MGYGSTAVRIVTLNIEGPFVSRKNVPIPASVKRTFSDYLFSEFYTNFLVLNVSFVCKQRIASLRSEKKYIFTFLFSARR